MATAAKPRRPARLKVFGTRLGFFDTIVAAPSQAAALRAWGVRQNLFADGEAEPVTDEAARKAALAQPLVPLRRPVGSTGDFETSPSDLPVLPEVRGRGRNPSARPAPDRSELDAAEARLARLRSARKAEEGRFQRRQASLDAARETASAAFEQARNDAEATLENARRAYRKAGGRL